MKTTPILLIATLLFSTAAAAFAEGSLGQVVAASAARETRRTLDIAPTSGVKHDVAAYAARWLSPLVQGTKVFTVAPTGSMRPLFDDNTVLLVEPSSYSSLKIGDIVVFRHSTTGQMIVHRILEKRRGGFWTKGDHNDRMDDELVTEANYQGRVYGILYTSRGNSEGAGNAGNVLSAAAR